MKAIVVREYGGTEVLVREEVPTPVPGLDEVLVEVRAVSVNRTLDLDIRAGTFRDVYRTVLPMILGVDPSGIVTALGENVNQVKVGDHVALTTHHQIFPCGECADCQDGRRRECASKRTIGNHRWGGDAQYVILPAPYVIKLPDNLPFPDATAIMRHAPTALSEVKRTGLIAGEKVLVMAAAGGLGAQLVQITKAMGCTVIGAAGADERVKLACELGADYGVNYRTQDLEQEVLKITDGAGVDVVFENISDPTLWPGAFNSLGRGGRLSTVGAHGGDFVTLHVRRMYQRNITIMGGGVRLQRPDYEEITSLAGAGKLRGVIDRIMPLADVREAHDLVASENPVGKVILDPTRI